MKSVNQADDRADDIVEVCSPNSRAQVNEDGGRINSLDKYDYRSSTANLLKNKRMRVHSSTATQKKDLSQVKRSTSNRKLHLAAMQKIASKLMLQMEPGNHFKKGQLPNLSIAQIEKAMNHRRKRLKAATSKNYAMLIKDERKGARGENHSRGAASTSPGKHPVVFSSVNSTDGGEKDSVEFMRPGTGAQGLSTKDMLK